MRNIWGKYQKTSGDFFDSLYFSEQLFADTLGSEVALKCISKDATTLQTTELNVNISYFTTWCGDL